MEKTDIEIGKRYQNGRGDVREVTARSPLFRDGVIYKRIWGKGEGQVGHVTRAQFAKWAVARANS